MCFVTRSQTPQEKCSFRHEKFLHARLLGGGSHGSDSVRRGQDLFVFTVWGRIYVGQHRAGTLDWSVRLRRAMRGTRRLRCFFVCLYPMLPQSITDRCRFSRGCCLRRVRDHRWPCCRRYDTHNHPDDDGHNNTCSDASQPDIIIGSAHCIRTSVDSLNDSDNKRCGH